MWSSVIRSCSPDLEEHSWRTNFSHLWPTAGLLEPQTAESAPSSLYDDNHTEGSKAVTCLVFSHNHCLVRGKNGT